MASLDLKSLISRLNSHCHQTLESAAGLCLSRTNFHIEVEHWLFKLTEHTDADFEFVAREFDIDVANLRNELQTSMDRFKTGNGKSPALSQEVVDMIKEACLIGSVEFGDPKVRSGYLLLAIAGDDGLFRSAVSSSPEMKKLNYGSLKASLAAICADSIEQASNYGGAQESGPAAGPRVATKTPSLDQFTIDLTERARLGEIDPVLGRDSEIRQLIDILCRRRQNNPILTGEPGVGKTAVAEGFALRVASNDVPPILQGISLRVLDLALLQAGAGVKGEFENRLKSVIEEVKSSPTPIILFIDEAHTLIGAGGQAGQGDAANLIKPALARGELRTIAATTWSEYKKYFEEDAALARRFQVVNVLEPSQDTAIDMLRGLVAVLEKHHSVRILSEAVEEAVKLSSRYISGRQLPDKAISLLDTTCARIGLSQNSIPPQIENCDRQLQSLSTTLQILEREQQGGADHQQRIDDIGNEIQELEAERSTLNDRWQSELNLVSQINERRGKLAVLQAQAVENAEQPPEPKEGGAGDAPESEDSPESIQKEIADFEGSLAEIQGDDPLVFACCDGPAIAATVAAWTGIPVGRMVSNEIRSILNLQEQLEQSVVGQSHAIGQIAERIQTSRAKLTDPGRPIGVFLLAGTSGVGKTETAVTLADILYGGQQNLTVVNMSEFGDEHKASALTGAAPGLVGYGKGGILTEAVRRKPYSVLLLDEMEKAHANFQDLFYQVFDKGHMKDSEGRDIDFKNTIIIMTSNAGTDLIKSLCADPDTAPEPAALTEALHAELTKTFKPAFLGRLDIIPYFPLSDEVMRKIIHLKLGKVAKRLHENYGASVSFTNAVTDLIASRCTEVDTGARNVDKILNKSLLPELSQEILKRMAESQEFSQVEVDAQNDQFAYALQ